METIPEPNVENISANKRIRRIAWVIIAMVVIVLVGLESGYFKWSLIEETELYASVDLISLSFEQQTRVEEVASAVYRP